MSSDQALRRPPKLRHVPREHTFATELTYEPSNYERAVLTFPKALSINQAFGYSAEIMSRDQKRQLISSLKSVMQKAQNICLGPPAKRSVSQPVYACAMKLKFPFWKGNTQVSYTAFLTVEDGWFRCVK